MTKNILISMALAGSLSAGAINVSAQASVDVLKSQVDIVPAVISTPADRPAIEGTLVPPDHVITLPDFLDGVPMPRPSGDFQIADSGNVSSGELPLLPDGPLLPLDPTKFTGVVEIGTQPRFFAGSGGSSIEPFKPVLTESGVVIAEADIAAVGSDAIVVAPEGVMTLSVVHAFDVQRSAELSARAAALEQLRTADPDQRAELIAFMSATQVTQAAEQRELARELRTELRALREERKGN